MFTLVSTRWLRRIEAKLDYLSSQGSNIMSALDDLNTAVTDLTTASNAYTAAVATEIAAIQAANQSGANDAAIEASVANLKVLTDSFNTAAAAATAAVPPAPAA